MAAIALATAISGAATLPAYAAGTETSAQWTTGAGTWTVIAAGDAAQPNSCIARKAIRKPDG